MPEESDLKKQLKALQVDLKNVKAIRAMTKSLDNDLKNQLKTLMAEAKELPE